MEIGRGRLLRHRPMAHAPGAAQAQTRPPTVPPEIAQPQTMPPQPVTTTFVPLGRHGQGLLWAPQTRGEAARTGIVLVHPFATSLGNIVCSGLAERGYLALCADPPTTNRPFRFAGYEAQAQTISAAIARLRQEPGVRSIVLAGYGEGGALAAFYQNVAQNGAAACQGPEKITPCDGARLAGLLPAAGLVLVDPDLGQAFTTLSSLDPAIIARDRAASALPRPRHVRSAQRLRSGPQRGRLSSRLPQGLPRRAGGAQRPAGRAGAQAGARRGRPRARRLLRRHAHVRRRRPDDAALAGGFGGSWRAPGGPTSSCPPTAPAPRASSSRSRCPPAIPARRRASGPAVAFSARQFLAGHAIETTPDYDVTADDVTGVVWASSTTSAVSNLAGVRDPLLVVAATAHSAVRPAEMVLDAAASADKELVGVEGATHALTPCQSCAGAQGRRFGDTAARALDYVADWLARRF